MLAEFLTTYREAIITRAREKVTNRPWPLASTSALEHGVASFVTQLANALASESTGLAYTPSSIGTTATLHGGELLALGFTVSQVVHDYGDVCQAITEIALEQHAPITTAECHTLNRCLDTAIAEAVTEHARIVSLTRAADEVERSGQLAHEMRDVLNTALIAFDALKRGTVAINGSTGAVLGRSLMGLRDLVGSTLCDIRLAANAQRRERLIVAAFLGDIASAATLHAELRGLHFHLEPVDARLAVNVDPQLVGSAIMNLLNNALKFTPRGGHVTLRAAREDRRVRIEVEDQCGGMPDGGGDPFQAFADRRGSDRTGLGLGLSIARNAVKAHDGDIHIRNMPGAGCVFVIELPLAGEGKPAPQPVQ